MVAKHLVNVALANLVVSMHQVARQGEYCKGSPERPIKGVDRHAHHYHGYAEKRSINYYSHNISVFIIIQSKVRYLHRPRTKKNLYFYV